MYEIDKLQSAWKGHRKFAEWLVTRLQPKVTVDLGVDYGYSTFCFANPKIGTVYGVDTFQGDPFTGVHNDAEETVQRVIAENGYDNVTIIKDTFDNVAETWCQPIDILHIDGVHSFHCTMNDYNKWSPFLHDRSVLLMHDVAAFDQVRVVYDRIRMHKCMFQHSAGLGVLSENENIISEIKQLYAI